MGNVQAIQRHCTGAWLRQLARLGGLEGVPLRKCLQISGGIF